MRILRDSPFANTQSIATGHLQRVIGPELFLFLQMFVYWSNGNPAQ
jgi:hypothetical protein